MPGGSADGRFNIEQLSGAETRAFRPASRVSCSDLLGSSEASFTRSRVQGESAPSGRSPGSLATWLEACDPHETWR